jgi:hypothetical protein
MMVENRTDEITALFARAGAAHHIYEQEVLNGVYHEDWFGWYAEYVIEHGIGALLGRDITVDEMIAFFKRISAEHKASGSAEAWTSYYARALG